MHHQHARRRDSQIPPLPEDYRNNLKKHDPRPGRAPALAEGPSPYHTKLILHLPAHRFALAYWWALRTDYLMIRPTLTVQRKQIQSINPLQPDLKVPIVMAEIGAAGGESGLASLSTIGTQPWKRKREFYLRRALGRRYCICEK